MKLTIKLSKEQRANLQEAKESLDSAHERLEAHNKSHRSSIARLEKLDTEKAELELAAQGGDRKASLEIHAIIDQKNRLGDTIRNAAASAAEDVYSLRGAVDHAQQLVSGIATRNIQDQLEDEIEELLAPHFTNRANARQVARGTDSMNALGRFFNGHVGESAAELSPLADRYSAAITNLLDGADVWRWTPIPAGKSGPKQEPVAAGQ